MDQAGQACEVLAKPPVHPAAGSAFYQQGELHRLRGDFDKAADCYRLASQHGRQPQPGLALLRLAQGQVDVAAAAVRHVIDERHNRPARAGVLAACAEIMLAAKDTNAARAAADRLASLRSDHETPFLRALCLSTTGAMLLAEGDAAPAMDMLRDAQAAWNEVGAPYETARVRVLIALANRALGDDEMALLELDAARDCFERLGARPDVERVMRLLDARPSHSGTKLTSRECEVLALIATGKDESRDCERPPNQREDRRATRQQHLRQARSVEPGRGDGVRLPARSGLKRREVQIPRCSRDDSGSST